MKECVGCGYCCIKTMCAVGEWVHGSVEERCPYLVWNGARYDCKIAKDYAEHLHIGAGCCSSLNTWRQDVHQREENEPWESKNDSMKSPRKSSAKLVG